MLTCQQGLSLRTHLLRWKPQLLALASVIARQRLVVFEVLLALVALPLAAVVVEAHELENVTHPNQLGDRLVSQYLSRRRSERTVSAWMEVQEEFRCPNHHPHS